MKKNDNEENHEDRNSRCILILTNFKKINKPKGRQKFKVYFNINKLQENK